MVQDAVAWVLGSMGAPEGAGCLSGEPSSAPTVSAAVIELGIILEIFQVSENLMGAVARGMQSATGGCYKPARGVRGS